MPELNEQHTGKVFELLLAGLSGERISEWVRSEKNKIGIKEEDLPALTQQAETRLREYSRFQFSTELGKSLKRLDELYARALQIQDFKGAASIERERAKLLQTNRRIDDTQPETPSDPQPINEVATLLGIAPRTLQLWCKGADEAHQPPMPHTQRPGARTRFMIDPAVASRHLQEHADRLPRSFRPYTGTQETTRGQTGVEEQLTSLISQDPEKVLHQLATSPEILEKLGPNRARVMVAACEGHRRARQAEEKLASMITAEQYIKDFRALGDLFCEHIEEIGAKRLASKLISFLRKRFNIDLGIQAGAASLIEYEIRSDHNTSLQSFRDECAEMCRRQSQLNFEQTGSNAAESPQGANDQAVPGRDGGRHVLPSQQQTEI